MQCGFPARLTDAYRHYYDVYSLSLLLYCSRVTLQVAYINLSHNTVTVLESELLNINTHY